MKPSFLFAAVLCLSGIACYSQSTDEEVKQLIFQKDSLFWKAYNSCDVSTMGSMFSNDIEFYHDKGGPSKGLDTLMAIIKKNLCSNENFRLRREVVKGSMKVFVMKAQDKTYGAILSGEHVFYINEKGKKEFIDGLAKFTHLWILNNDSWKMTRILSYDHGPAPESMKQ